MTLFLVCGIAAGSLAFVNKATKPQIDEYARIAQEEALKRVFPEAESFTVVTPDAAWDAVAGGAVIGTVHQVSIQGYSGPIQVMFGLNAQGAVTGARVLSHTETPGLGAKITTAEFINQYAGKTADQVVLKKDDPSRGAIDAISAATISSRAVTKAIREAMKAAAGAAGTQGGSAAGTAAPEAGGK
jgi:electron transport complex protein RnfG